MPVTTRSVTNQKINLPPVYTKTIEKKSVRYFPTDGFISLKTLTTVVSLAGIIGTAAGASLGFYDLTTAATLLTTTGTFLDGFAGYLDRKLFAEEHRNSQEAANRQVDNLVQIEADNQRRNDLSVSPRNFLPKFRSTIDTQNLRSYESWGTSDALESIPNLITSLNLGVQALSLFTTAAYETEYFSPNVTDYLGKASAGANATTLAVILFANYVYKLNQNSFKEADEAHKVSLETFIFQTRLAYKNT